MLYKFGKVLGSLVAIFVFIIVLLLLLSLIIIILREIYMLFL